MLAGTCARAAGRSVRAVIPAIASPSFPLHSGGVTATPPPASLDSASNHAFRTGVPPFRPITIDTIAEREMELRNEQEHDHEPSADLVGLGMFEEGLAFDLMWPEDDTRRKKAWCKPEKPLAKVGKREKTIKRAKFEAMSEQIFHEGMSQGVGLAVRSARASRRSLRKLVRRVTDSAMLGEDFEMALEPLYLQNEQQQRQRPRWT